MVLSSPNNTDDGTVHKLAYDIARKIEAEMKYPGQIKVNVSRGLNDGDLRSNSNSKSFVCFVVFAHLARRTSLYDFAAVPQKPPCLNDLG